MTIIIVAALLKNIDLILQFGLVAAAFMALNTYKRQFRISNRCKTIDKFVHYIQEIISLGLGVQVDANYLENVLSDGAQHFKSNSIDYLSYAEERIKEFKNSLESFNKFDRSSSITSAFWTNTLKEISSDYEDFSKKKEAFWVMGANISNLVDQHRLNKFSNEEGFKETVSNIKLMEEENKKMNKEASKILAKLSGEMTELMGVK